MIKIDHIGIAVKDLKSSISVFETLMSSECYKTEVVESERVITAFLRKGETKIELLESSDSDGVIARFIEKKVKAFTTLLSKLTTSMPKWNG